MSERRKVVIIGGGFAGLSAAQHVAGIFRYCIRNGRRATFRLLGNAADATSAWMSPLRNREIFGHVFA